VNVSTKTDWPLPIGQPFIFTYGIGEGFQALMELRSPRLQWSEVYDNSGNTAFSLYYDTDAAVIRPGIFVIAWTENTTYFITDVIDLERGLVHASGKVSGDFRPDGPMSYMTGRVTAGRQAPFDPPPLAQRVSTDEPGHHLSAGNRYLIDFGDRSFMLAFAPGTKVKVTGLTGPGEGDEYEAEPVAVAVRPDLYLAGWDAPQGLVVTVVLDLAAGRCWASMGTPTIYRAFLPDGVVKRIPA
jgi:hypothetical protein